MGRPRELRTPIERLDINPISPKFGEIVLVLGNEFADGRYLTQFRDGSNAFVHRKWLRSPDYPIERPNDWSKAVDINTREKLLNDVHIRASRDAWKAVSEEFEGLEQSTKNSAFGIIYSMFTEPVHGERDRVHGDAQTFFYSLSD